MIRGIRASGRTNEHKECVIGSTREGFSTVIKQIRDQEVGRIGRIALAQLRTSVTVQRVVVRKEKSTCVTLQCT